jgi:uncharacterized protein
VDVLFLDANVLFSAAYRAESGLRRLWALPGVKLVTSAYAAEEARRNLRDLDQRHRLAALVATIRVVEESGVWRLPADVLLPEKDRPIVSGAISSGATHLITGDAAHFGVWYGKALAGVLVMRPATYLESRNAQPHHDPAAAARRAPA